VRNRRRLLAPAILSVALLQMLPAAARAGDPDFHSLVERMSDYYQKRPMRFMGWLNFFANRFTPGDVSHFQMAIFDDVEASRTHPSEDLESSLASLVGPSYQPFVNVHNVRESGWMIPWKEVETPGVGLRTLNTASRRFPAPGPAGSFPRGRRYDFFGMNM